ncbi:MAG: glutathione S-transferase family protein [Solirubrobacterales bacterium]
MTDRTTVENEVDSDSGRFNRQTSEFRRWVSTDGSTDFPAEAGRYHLYVCLACPWAHRAIITRRIKGLEDAISMSLVDPIRDEKGWRFGDAPGSEPDPLHGWDYLSEAYEATDPGYDARVTVPVLWDTETGVIVNNESADVIRMLNNEFDELADHDVDLEPAALRDEIAELNAHVYQTVNDGVYQCGFAGSQKAYEEAFGPLFATLDELERRLADRRFLMGDQLTLADIRLFTTVVRFDPVYTLHFRCNLRRIIDYPNLWGWVRDVYQWPGIADTVSIEHIKRHYYCTHESLNPKRIVPVGPDIDYTTPHGREALAG